MDLETVDGCLRRAEQWEQEAQKMHDSNPEKRLAVRLAEKWFDRAKKLEDEL